MSRFSVRTTIVFALWLALIAVTPRAFGQPQSGVIYRLFGEVHLVSLAQLEEVVKALALSDEQRSEVAKLNEELNARRMEAFRDAAGDFDAMRETTMKLYTDYHGKLSASLDEAQQKRAEEIYVQVNGPTALNSTAIAEKLQLSEEQRKKLAEASIDHWLDTFDSFQDMQNMSEEERAKTVEDLIKARDKSLLAVLTDEQKKQFEAMGGEKLEVDLDKLPMPGPRQ